MPSTPAPPRRTCRRTPGSPRRTSTTTTGSIRKTRPSRSSIPACRSACRSRRRRSASRSTSRRASVEVTKEVPVQYPLREGHLLRRQAHGAERRAGVFGAGHARAGGDSGARGQAKAVEREIHVTVTNGTKGAAKATVALELPAGWKVDAGQRADRFRARGRIALGALSGDALRRRSRPASTRCARSSRRPRRATRSSPTAIRRSNIRTSSAGR